MPRHWNVDPSFWGGATVRLPALLLLAVSVACGDGQRTVGPDPDGDPLVAVISVVPGEVQIFSLGDTARLVATAMDEGGRVVQDIEVAWQSGSPAVAAVDGSGLVSAVANGRATITATVDSVTGVAQVIVEQRASSLVLAPVLDSLSVGDSVRMSAQALDAGGSPVADVRLRWASSDVATATVDADGWVRTLRPGRVEITSSVGDVAGSATIVSLPLSDAEILRRFFDAAGGPVWKNSENWLTDAALTEWHGVEVNDQGRVAHLQLDDNGLIGTLSPSVAGLGSLVSLHLGVNELTGPIPPEIGRLAGLLSLDLSYNVLTGSIPPEIGDLAELRRLGLFGNLLTGSIPPEMGQLANLELLDLCYNKLSGPIPSELGKLTELRTLALCGIDLDLEEGNRLSGSIPAELGNLTRLRSLNLGANLLTGPIPPELGNLAALDSLSLYSNLLTEIPHEIGRLRGLEFLVAYGNRLAGPIPLELGELASLRVLNLGRGYSNGDNLLTGPVPPELGQLGRLERLDLGGNDLSGEIPPELSQLSLLEGLELGSNALTGPIPRELGDLAALTRLSLCTNGLTGPIPPELGRALALRQLFLCSNRLGGTLPPALGDLIGLRHLHVGENQLRGVVPDELASLRRLLTFTWARNDGLCVPAREPFLAWIGRLSGAHGDYCAASATGQVAARTGVACSVAVERGRVMPVEGSKRIAKRWEVAPSVGRMAGDRVGTGRCAEVIGGR